MSYNNASDYSEQDKIYEVLNCSYTAEDGSGCKESEAESGVERVVGGEGSSAAQGRKATLVITEKTPIWDIPRYTDNKDILRDDVLANMCATEEHGYTKKQCETLITSAMDTFGYPSIKGKPGKHLVEYTSRKHRFSGGRGVYVKAVFKQENHDIIVEAVVEDEENDPLYCGETFDRSDNELQGEEADVLCIPNFKDLCRLS